MRARTHHIPRDGTAGLCLLNLLMTLDTDTPHPEGWQFRTRIVAAPHAECDLARSKCFLPSTGGIHRHGQRAHGFGEMTMRNRHGTATDMLAGCRWDSRARKTCLPHAPRTARTASGHIHPKGYQFETTLRPVYWNLQWIATTCGCCARGLSIRYTKRHGTRRAVPSGDRTCLTSPEKIVKSRPK